MGTHTNWKSIPEINLRLQ